MIDSKFNYSLYDVSNAHISYDSKLVNDENSFKKKTINEFFHSLVYLFYSWFRLYKIINEKLTSIKIIEVLIVVLIYIVPQDYQQKQSQVLHQYLYHP